MTANDWLSLVIVLFCLLLSAFFAGSETALTASSRAIMTRLEKHGNKRAGVVNRLLEQRERLLGALLFGNNAVNIAASALATGVLLAWFGNAGVVYATVAMTIMVVVFSEILPKTAAFNAPDRIALAVAAPPSEKPNIPIRRRSSRPRSVPCAFRAGSAASTALMSPIRCMTAWPRRRVEVAGSLLSWKLPVTMWPSGNSTSADSVGWSIVATT